MIDDHDVDLYSGGEAGIRTLAPLARPTGFQDRTLQPLGYFSSMQQNDFCNISILAEKYSICKHKFQFISSATAAILLLLQEVRR